MPIVIKKKVSLDFLGEEYKEAYLLFRAIPLDDYSDIAKGQTEDNAKAFELIKDTLAKYFKGGKFPDENGELADVKADELGQFPGEVALKCFEALTGQVASEEGATQVDPLSQNPS